LPNTNDKEQVDSIVDLDGFTSLTSLSRLSRYAEFSGSRRLCTATD